MLSLRRVKCAPSARREEAPSHESDRPWHRSGAAFTGTILQQVTVARVRRADVINNWGPENGTRPAADPTVSSLFLSAKVAVALSCHADPAALWSLMTDPTRIGDFSDECVLGEWIAPFSESSVGARFQGTNQAQAPDGRLYQWTRPCTITIHEPLRRYAYLTHDRWDVPASKWMFDLSRTGGVITVTHSFEHLPEGLSGTRMAIEALPVDDQRDALNKRLATIEAGMNATLARMTDLCRG